jgi:hypothetical protein
VRQQLKRKEGRKQVMMASAAHQKSGQGQQDHEQDRLDEGEKKNCPSLRPPPPRAPARLSTPRPKDQTEAITSPLVANYETGISGLAQTAPDPSTSPNSQPIPAVRFRSTIEEIAPDDATSRLPTVAKVKDVSLGDPAEVTPEQIRDLADRLKACPLQERRMSIFSYEAFSLPPSRVCLES